MKANYRYILLATAAMMVAAACTKTRMETLPQGAITLSAVDAASSKSLLNKGTYNQTPGTKAMLDATTFQTEGNRIQIYDFVDNATTPHVNDEIESDGPGVSVWPFVGGKHSWIPGTHKFFGWLALDKNMESNNDPKVFFSTNFSFDNTTKVLTIPEKEMTASTPQFDFMYSNIVSTQPQAAPVELSFGHLFSAYFFSFTNDSAEDLKLESAKLNIKSKASASLNYSGTEPVVSIGFTSDQQAIEKEFNSSIGAGQTIDLFMTGEVIESASEIPNDSYRLIWPQNLTDATVDIVFTAKISIPFFRYNSKGGPYIVYESEEAEGGPYIWNGSYFEYVGKGNGTHNVYFQHGQNGVYEEIIPDATEQTVSKSISLADVTSKGEWKAGEKYNYNISFSNDDIDMVAVVMRWDGGHGGNIEFD